MLLSQIQSDLDAKGIFSYIDKVNNNKFDLIINYQVVMTTDNISTIERILRRLLKSKINESYMQ